jgi:hypothetical protein
MAHWPYNTKAWRDLREAKLEASPCAKRGPFGVALTASRPGGGGSKVCTFG